MRLPGLLRHFIPKSLMTWRQGSPLLGARISFLQVAHWFPETSWHCTSSCSSVRKCVDFKVHGEMYTKWRLRSAHSHGRNLYTRASPYFVKIHMWLTLPITVHGKRHSTESTISSCQSTERSWQIALPKSLSLSGNVSKTDCLHVIFSSHFKCGQWFLGDGFFD